jgi:hypothetical protein
MPSGMPVTSICTAPQKHFPGYVSAIGGDRKLTARVRNKIEETVSGVAD